MAVQAQHPSNALLSDWRNRMRQVITCDNRNVLSAVESSSTVDDAQLQLQAQNSVAPNQWLLLNAYHGPSLEQQQQMQNSFANLNEANVARNLLGKRPRESYDMLPAPRLKPLSIPVAEVLPNQVQAVRGNICTGLCLAFNDESSISNVAPTNVQIETTLFSSLNGRLASQMNQYRDEIDQYLRLQAKQMKEALEEKRLRHFKMLFALVEEGASKKFREKDAEVEKINRKNMELEERLKQLSMEAHLWQSKAKSNEAMISALRVNLQQAEAQSKELMNREGSGDSEAVDDAASSHGGGNGDYHSRVHQENKELKEQRSCKVCRSNDVCMLLLPCRHLCLCKNCEGRLDLCPLCRSLKSASVQVYMS